MVRYSYTLKDYRSWLKGFAKILQMPIIEKRMQIPSDLGDGFIYASAINKGISYVIFNIRLHDDLILLRKKGSTVGLSLAFNQAEGGDFFKAHTINDTMIDRTPKQSNIYLSSTNMDVELTFSRNSNLKIVVIYFSPDFLNKALKKDILIDLMMYTGEVLRNANKVPITFEYRQLLNDIFAVERPSPMSNLILQNRILLLTEKFLSTFLEKGLGSKSLGTKKNKEKEKDIRALKQVEEMLKNTSLDKFPSINTLSKTAMMSSTKLKTKFKTVYGMKLYEFYNRNRLEKARDLLQSGLYSVKEVGHEIGFSNLSNFAKAFKKEFGILPKEMLRIKS
jgi:AraC-like DNA-binding protein